MSTRGSRPLRVAFLQATLPFGGAEKLIETLVLGVDRAMIEPVVVNLYGPGALGENLERAGVRTVNDLARSRVDLATGRRLRACWEREGIEAVHLFDSALPMFWAGLERRRAAHPPLVVGFHSTGKSYDPLQYFLANRMLHPVADRFVALAPSHLEFLAGHYGIARERFDLIRSGVNLSAFVPAPDRAAVRAALGLPAGVPLAGIVAALRPEKHVVGFVDAAARVHAVVPEARFVIVGEGEERSAIEAAIAAHGLGDVVRLLGARNDVARLWQALDVAVLTSRTETVPVSLMEAHACGLPSIAPDVGSVRDVIVDGETGFVTPAGDVAALAGRLAALLADAPLRARMGVAARARAEACFDQAAMVRAYQDLFIRVAASAARGR